MPTSGATSFSKSSTSISSGRRKPFLFLSNLLWRRKKVLEIGEIDDIFFDRNHRTRSEPSVISYSCTTTMTSHEPQLHHVPHKNASMLTMTPGRDLDQDMHALRLSRQDNPFVQKVLASRESLIDTLDDQSDDAILMASEEINPDFDDDPFMLPEVKEHMIRSPPPTTWPRSPQYMFTYNQDNNLTISSHSSDEDTGYNGHSSVRAQDMFLRTTSVPASSRPPQNEQNHYHLQQQNSGLNIPLSRPKSNSVNMTTLPTKAASLHESGTSLGGSQFNMDTSAVTASGGNTTSMILRPQCLFDEGSAGVRRLK